MTRLRPVLFGALLFAVSGCGSAPPGNDLLAADVARLQNEARRLAGDAESQELLETSARLSLSAEGAEPAEATRRLEEARAAASASIAAATAARLEAEADDCLRAAADRQREWQDAVRMLEQTEKVSGRTARGIKRVPPPISDRSSLPPDPPAPADTLSGSAGIEKRFRDWKEAATARKVPVADLDGVVIQAMSTAGNPEIEPEIRDHRFRLAAWATVELSNRVQAEEGRRGCREALDRAIEFGQYRDQALWAMVDLERSMKDNVRRELEEERERAADREQALYESLRQFEGEFAQIRREARGTILSLSDILFDFGKSDLRREAEINLAKIGVILQQYPEMNILVEGHTDNIGSEEYNLKLSEARAKSVYDFLVSQGLPAERMETKGYGMSQPVESNETPEGRQANRRVDLVIREE